MLSGEVAIETMVDRIVQRFDPLRIILFGSHARGTAGNASDVDLLVVFAEVSDRRRAAVDIRRLLGDMSVSKDIVVTTPSELARRGNLVGGVLRPALREGKVVYERP
jgi:predicted nucleotidyltransferase